MKLTKEEAFEAAELAIETKHEPWKWGTINTYVFAQDGKHFRFSVEVHSQDGWQIYGTVDAEEVKPVRKTITEWVKA